MSASSPQTLLPVDEFLSPHTVTPSGAHRLGRSTRLEQIKQYLSDVMTDFTPRVGVAAPTDPVGQTAERIFRILTGRQFCHLGRARVQKYREDAVSRMEAGMQRGGPLEFWYDVGPGYHASLRPGTLDLSFTVGFSELLILRQVVAFCGELKQHHSAGAHFRLVVDNLCALRTNDIDLSLTEAYCDRFRELIRGLGLGSTVEILVESEAFDVSAYDGVLATLATKPPAQTLCDDDLQNVMRFIGRHCSVEEAARRIETYRRASIATEQLLARIVHGVRLSQRASATTLGFRPYPGGDSRTQCGEVALTRSGSGKLRPILLTSNNIDTFQCTRYSCQDQLPPTISHVTYAAKPFET